MTKLPIALALAATLLAPAALAQSRRSDAMAALKAEFYATDTNHDHVLTRAEVTARFRHMRVASAGQELDAVHAKRLADLWFDKTDANHDGKVTLAESQATMAAVFDRYDTNHDGVLSPEERAAAKAGAVAGQ